MDYVNGEFYMRSAADTDPYILHSAEDMIRLVEKIGFLPLFSNRIPGFSVEEHTPKGSWWTRKTETDPWEWRVSASPDDRVVYGKFFERKAGYIAKKWFPFFANFRRDGYDFDALYDDGLAPYRHKILMNEFEEGKSWLSPELKAQAGFGKEGEKNFPGIVTELQMQTYLVTGAFRQRRNKKGKEYGMAASVLMMPETKWGYSHVSSAYAEDPAFSWERLITQIKSCFPEASESDIRAVLGIRRTASGREIG